MELFQNIDLRTNDKDIYCILVKLQYIKDILFANLQCPLFA